jgi:2-keto-3-deoxy-galactonokinase
LSSSPALVSVDWGTGAFRARLAAADGVYKEKLAACLIRARRQGQAR